MLEKPLTKTFIKIWQYEITPEHADLAEITLHKKGDMSQLNNYKPINLYLNLSKIFMKVVKEKIYKQLDENQVDEQVGFRKGYSTIDHTLTFGQIIEKAREYGIQIHLMFVDFYKAFHSVDINCMLEAITKHGVHGNVTK